MAPRVSRATDRIVATAILSLLLAARVVVAADVAVAVSSTAFAHALKREMHETRDAILRHRPAALHDTYLNLDIVLDNLQVVHLEMPQLAYAINDPASFDVQLLGGSARVLGTYSAKYKTLREGQVELLLDNFELVLPVTSAPHGTFDVVGSCSLKIEDVDIVMTPPLPKPIIDKLRGSIVKSLEKEACQLATSFVPRLVEKYTNAFHFVDVAQSGRPAKFNVALHLKDGEMDLSEGLTNNAIDDVETNATADNVDGDEDVNADVKTIDVRVSESVVNAELAKLFADANTQFNWHRVPELAELVQQCGDATACKPFADGELVSTFRAVPTIQMDTGAARVLLPLATTMTLHGRKLFVVDVDMHLNVDKLVVHSPKDDAIPWSARYSVASIKVKWMYSSRHLHWLAESIEKALQERTELIASVMSSYLRGSLPVEVADVVWRPATAHFREHAAVFHLLPHFAPPLHVI